jgi:hypothetical protein
MILRLLNWQGIAGIAASLALASLLVEQAIDARHWRKSSDRFEQLLTSEKLAFATTTASYREAAHKARADDRANAARVAAQQQSITEGTEHEFQIRLADARARADRLRQELAAGSADSGSGGAASMPGLPAAAGGPAQAAGDQRLPASLALTATEQAIQLDELIKWVRRQAAVDPSGSEAGPVHP